MTSELALPVQQQPSASATGDGGFGIPPAVAVLMCVHGGADAAQFGEAVASIHGQSYTRLHVYLYCDGPLSVAHHQVVKKLDTSPGRDVVLQGDLPIGLPGGLNLLIDRAMQRPDIAFVARMDADDISVAQRIERQVSFFQRHTEVEVAGTWCIEFATPGNALFHKQMPIKHAELIDFMLYRSPFNHPTVMFRRSVLERGFRYDPTLKQMQDYDLWARLVCAGVVIGNLPEFLLWFRVDKSFYKRRAGVDRAAREIAMRVRYARSIGKLRAVNYSRYGALFLLRVAPAWAKKLGYKYFRAV